MVGLLLMVIALLGTTIWTSRRSGKESTSSDPEFVEAGLIQTTETPEGGLVISMIGEAQPLFELVPLGHESLDVLSGRHPVPFDPSAPFGLGALVAATLSNLPKTKTTTVYEVVFRPETQAKLKAKTVKLVQTSHGKMPAVRGDKGRIIEHGRLVKKEVAALGKGELFSAVAVAGAALMQLEQANDLLADIDERIKAITQRLQDDDHGEIAAAEALVESVFSMLVAGDVPHQLRLELAVTRQRVNAIYFARQRFVERFRSRIEQLQQAESERKGADSRSWAKGTTREFSRQEALKEEALLYARAMVSRAQLSFCTAGVIALTEGGSAALSLLRQTEAELTRSFGDLNQLLQALADERPSWAWLPFTDRKEVHDTARSLAALFGDEVRPLLPRPTGSEVRFIADSAPRALNGSSFETDLGRPE